MKDKNGSLLAPVFVGHWLMDTKFEIILNNQKSLKR